MNCPHCNSSLTKVIDSRDASYGRHRVRKCLRCELRHITVEIIVRDTPMQGKQGLLEDVKRRLLLEALNELTAKIRRRLPLKER